MSNEAEKPMTDEEIKADSRRRMEAAVESLREMFAVRRMSSDHEGHRLGYALLEEAMTKGSNVGMAKKRYMNNTTEDLRRDAAGIIYLLAQITGKMQEVLSVVSGNAGDSFAVRVDLEEGYDCGNPDCPVHGKNAPKPGDTLTPEQLDMLPPHLAKGFGELMKQGLVVTHLGKHGPFGAMEMHGPKHLLALADKLMNSSPLPDTIESEIDRQPMDSHTQEISDALDRAFGRKRSHLPPKDIPPS
jgi:hypothetical protein